MDENRYCIPPCCVDKKLPQAVMQAPRRALTFYTMGDVTVEKFYKAVAYLVSDPHVMVLTMPTLTFPTASYLAMCFERGWITDLVLSTNKDVSSLVEQYLAPYAGHVLYTHTNNVSDFSSHMVLYSHCQSLSIVGPMVEVCLRGYSMVSYSMLFTARLDISTSQEYANSLLNVLYPDIERHRKAKAHIDRYSERLHKFLNSELPPYEY